jgi:hypothetical protein
MPYQFYAPYTPFWRFIKTKILKIRMQKAKNGEHGPTRFCTTAVRVQWGQWHISFNATSNLLPQKYYLKKKLRFTIAVLKSKT